MGQYFRIVNIDRGEYVDPWRLGSGAKLFEICANIAGVLPYLLRKSSEGGGGDAYGVDELHCAGRWAGERIVVIGDYDESGLFQTAGDALLDISETLIEEYNQFMREPSLMVGKKNERRVKGYGRTTTSQRRRS